MPLIGVIDENGKKDVIYQSSEEEEVWYDENECTCVYALGYECPCLPPKDIHKTYVSFLYWNKMRAENPKKVPFDDRFGVDHTQYMKDMKRMRGDSFTEVSQKFHSLSAEDREKFNPDRFWHYRHFAFKEPNGSKMTDEERKREVPECKLHPRTMDPEAFLEYMKRYEEAKAAKIPPPNEDATAKSSSQLDSIEEDVEDDQPVDDTAVTKEKTKVLKKKKKDKGGKRGTKH